MKTLDQFQLTYWILASIAAAIRVYFAWSKHNRDTQLLLDEEQSRVENLRQFVRDEVVEVFSHNLSDVRHLYLELEPLERLRKEFDLLFAKPDVVTHVRGLHETLLHCEQHKRRVRRFQLIRRLAAASIIVTGAGAVAPLANQILVNEFEYTTINWMALLITVQLAAAVVCLVSCERRIRSNFRDYTTIEGEQS